MNEDAYLERLAEEEFERTNNRKYEPFKYAVDDPKFGPECCEECGVNMPFARREYGFNTCVPCKELTE